jgi:hypothetical protein
MKSTSKFFCYLLMLLLVVAFHQFANSSSTGNNALTHQTPDLLIIESDTVKIFSNPLEAIFNDDYQRPDDIFGDDCGSTSCWRGYIGLWQLSRDSLFLNDILSCCSEESLDEKELSELTQGRFQNGRAFADWVSHKILIPIGERLYYEHMGYNSVYEKEVHLDFENGILVKTDTLSNSPTHDASFPDGLEGFQDYVIQNLRPEFTSDEELFFIIALEIDKNGTAIVDTVYRSDDPELLENIKDIVNNSPNWNPAYWKGELTDQFISIPIRLSINRE